MKPLKVSSKNTKNKAFSFDQIPVSERRKILINATKKANDEQFALVKEYRAKRCNACK